MFKSNHGITNFTDKDYMYYFGMAAHNVTTHIADHSFNWGLKEDDHFPRALTLSLLHGEAKVEPNKPFCC